MGYLSEEGLESNNKDIRNFLETHSRKCSREDQLLDVMQRLLERSDPKVLAQIRAQRNPKRCTACGSLAHTIRSHDRIQQKASSGDYNRAVMDILVIKDSVQ